jgi:DNA helicase-2/ATP-dependent DNA helicase PcrA
MRILDLQKDFCVTQPQLPESYRCHNDVINIANSLIQYNVDRSPEEGFLASLKVPYSGRALFCYGFETFDDEANYIAKEIPEKRRNDRYDCVVLARNKKLLNVILLALKKHGISTYTSVHKYEFHTAPFVMLQSMLRLANNHNDRISLLRLTASFKNLVGLELDNKSVISRASLNGENLLRAWFQEASGLAIDNATQQFLKVGVKPLFESLDYDTFSNNFIEWFVSRNIDSQEIVLLDDFDEEFVAWKEFLLDISHKCRDDSVDLHKFLSELDANSKKSDGPSNAVPCYTLQETKGMEFPHVYLAGLVEDYLPSCLASKKDDSCAAIQEERRNCFLAITRAQKSLTLTYSKSVFGEPKNPSRFLREMGFKIL